MNQRIYVLAAGMLLLGFYIRHMAPTITIGDSAELAAVGGTLGIAHSPGYPLFSLTSRVGSAAFPFARTAYRTNLLSALWVAASVTMVALTLLEITGSLGVALIAGLVLGSGPLWMGQAMPTEVFGLNSFLASVLLYVSSLPASAKNAYAAAYILGIGLGNNHTLILLAPALAIAFWPLIRQEPLRMPFRLAGWLILGISMYLFVPLRAHAVPVMNWEEPSTWERFWKLFTRARYGSFQLAQGSVPQIVWADVVNQSRYILKACWESFGPWCIAILAGLGAVRKPERRRFVITLVAAFLMSGLFFLIWTHLSVTPRTRSVLDRFMYLPLVPAGLLLGLGLQEIVKTLQALGSRLKGTPSRRSLEPAAWSLERPIVFLILGLLSLFWTYAHATPDERRTFYVWDVGRNLLRNAPPGALLFADRADEAEFSIAYLQRAENRRRDISFYDCNAGVSASIYGPSYYDVWGRPRLALRTIEERKRIAAWPGPTYYATHDPAMIPIPRVQEGLLFVVPGKGAAPVATAWDQLHVFRRPGRRPGKMSMWDRGMYADYLDLLAQDAFQAGRRQRGLELFQGAKLYAHSYS